MAIQHTLYISATRLKTDSALQGSNCMPEK